ncbi:MAG TPA: geranylgeranylglycerol-phosphate geranylgeranyltransferase [Bacteroidales bacterium]|nr:geranylgeranylglycerol-phosphate geranylgeranyltransferase [Bacteroidales bacterium]
MVTITEFLQLVRWRNLLLVAITMILMRYAVLEPLIRKIPVVLSNNPAEQVSMELQFPFFNFLLLVLATLCITAGGYVINDYFDIKTDLINRGKVIVGTRIPRRTAMMWHSVLNIAGVIIGFYISWRAGYAMMGALFLIVSGLLYFYSASYKRQFLVGNIIVAILTAAVPMLVAIYEWPALYRFYIVNAISMPDLDFVLYWVGGFAVFAFITTLAREIIKDIEDFEGDIAYGRNTLPVVLGIKTSKAVAGALVVITILMLFLAWKLYVNDLITIIYLSVAVAIPLLVVIYRLTGTNTKEKLHSASTFMKVAMFFGVLYSVLVWIIINWDLY